MPRFYAKLASCTGAAALLAAWNAPALATGAGDRVAELEPAILTLIVNQVVSGESTVLIAPGGDVWLEPHDLERAGFRAVSGSTVALDGLTWVSLRSLAPSVRYELDVRDLELVIEAAPDLLAGTRIDLASSGAPRGMVQHKDTSVFLNYAPRAIDGRRFETFGELGVSAGGHLFSSGVSADSERGVVRGQSSLLLDFPERLERWTIGDAFVSGGLLGGAALLGGVTFARSFDLDPYRSHTPSLDLGGSVPSPSTVEVYVNDTLIRREALPPGPFELNNIKVPAGQGALRYVVRDALGRVQQFETSTYSAASALAPGQSDFSYSAGLIRSEAAIESWSYDEPVVIGRHRVGLSSAITAGFRFDAGRGRLAIGPTATWVGSAGQIDLALSGSAGLSGDAGAAGLLAYSFTSRHFGVTAAIRGATARYATVSLAPEDDKRWVDSTTSVNLAFGPWALGAQAGVSLAREAGLSAFAALSSSIELGSGLSASLEARRAELEGRRPFGEIFGTVRYQLGGVNLHTSGKSALGGPTLFGGTTAGSPVSPGEASLEIGANRPLSGAEDYGFRASANVLGPTRADVSAQGQLAFGRAGASVLVIGDEPHAIVEAAGAVAWVEGAGLFLARPIQQGFAVIEVPGAEGVRAYLNNQEVGATDGRGMLLVSDLLPFYGNRLSIADTDLGLDYAVAEVERVVAPPNRGAAHVVFRARRTRFARGHVLVERGLAGARERFVPAFGELTAGATSSPIGAGGEFELAIEGDEARSLAFEVEAPGMPPCRARIAVPESRAGADPIVELGTIVCLLPSDLRAGVEGD